MGRELIESYYEEYQRELERFLESDPEMFTLEGSIETYLSWEKHYGNLKYVDWRCL